MKYLAYLMIALFIGFTVAINCAPEAKSKAQIVVEQNDLRDGCYFAEGIDHTIILTLPDKKIQIPVYRYFGEKKITVIFCVKDGKFDYDSIKIVE